MNIYPEKIVYTCYIIQIDIKRSLDPRLDDTTNNLSGAMTGRSLAQYRILGTSGLE